MAKIHVLESSLSGDYRVILHAPLPITKNTAGIAWKDAAKNSGLTGISVLPVGTGPGQISSTELLSITNGDVIEIIGIIATVEDPILLEQKADEIIAATINSLTMELKNYGYTL